MINLEIPEAKNEQERRVDELRDVVIRASEADVGKLADGIFALTESLKQKMTAEGRSPDEVFKYRLYHLISGSTPRPGQCTEFDLPGGDIENFIVSLSN